MWEAILAFLQQAGQAASTAGSAASSGLGKVGSTLSSLDSPVKSILDIGQLGGMLRPKAPQMQDINRNSTTGQPSPFQLPAAQSAAGAGNNQQLMQLIQSLLRK